MWGGMAFIPLLSIPGQAADATFTTLLTFPRSREEDDENEPRGRQSCICVALKLSRRQIHIRRAGSLFASLFRRDTVCPVLTALWLVP